MKKLTLHPTQIHLKELPKEGRVLEFSRESSELNETLEDLIHHNPYAVHLEIRPLGNVYEVKGTVETHLNLQCPRCASEIQYPIRQAVNEILVITEGMGRGTHQSRVNHVNELEAGAPGCTELTSDIFNLGEFVHEIVALAEPLQPLGDSPCGPECEDLLDLYQKGLIGQTRPEDEGFHPFAALKNLKLRN